MEEVPKCFNEGKLSDDEQNSWADGLSDSEKNYGEELPPSGLPMLDPPTGDFN